MNVIRTLSRSLACEFSHPAVLWGPRHVQHHLLLKIRKQSRLFQMELGERGQGSWLLSFHVVSTGLEVGRGCSECIVQGHLMQQERWEREWETESQRGEDGMNYGDIRQTRKWHYVKAKDTSSGLTWLQEAIGSLRDRIKLSKAKTT